MGTLPKVLNPLTDSQLQQRLDSINRFLKQDFRKVQLIRHKKHVFLQFTAPLRPGDRPSVPGRSSKQYKLGAGYTWSAEGLERAYTNAQKIADKLFHKQFTWEWYDSQIAKKPLSLYQTKKRWKPVTSLSGAETVALLTHAVELQSDVTAKLTLQQALLALEELLGHSSDVPSVAQVTYGMLAAIYGVSVELIRDRLLLEDSPVHYPTILSVLEAIYRRLAPIYGVSVGFVRTQHHLLVSSRDPNHS